MKRLLILILFPCFMVGCYYPSTYSDYSPNTSSSMALGGEISDSQPISSGEELYFVTYQTKTYGNNYNMAYSLRYVGYTYQGIENNCFKIKKEQKNTSGGTGMKDSKDSEETILSIPINKNKQGLLSVVDKNRGKKNILLTVVDDFGRITAEEYVEE